VAEGEGTMEAMEEGVAMVVEVEMVEEVVEVEAMVAEARS